MKIFLKIDSAIGVLQKETSGEINITEGLDLEGLVGFLGITGEKSRYILFFVNNQQQKKEFLLQEGDHVNLIAPVSGG